MNALLTPKEAEITRLVSLGMRNQDIAPIVGNTENVIKNYLRVIFDKCGVWNRLELALWYVKGQRSTVGDLYFDI